MASADRHRPVLAVRVDGRLALSARAPQGRLHLGHRRLLVPRHHARRRDADHRHGGDERLPRTSCSTRSSASTATCVVQPIEQPLDRLRRGGRAHLAACRGVVLAMPLVEGQALASSPFACGRRAGARHRAKRTCKRLPAIADNIRTGSLDGLRRRARAIAIGTRLADSLSAARRRQRHAGLAARRRHAARHHAADQGLSGRRPIFEIGMSEYDATFVFMPLDRGAALFQPAERCQRHRGLCSTIPTRSTQHAPAIEAGGRAAGLHRRLAAAQRDLLHRAAGRAQRDVPDPDADRAGGRAQHHLRPDHAGEGQGPATSPSCAPWARRAARSCASSSSPGPAIGVVGTIAGFALGAAGLPQHRGDPRSSSRGCRRTELFSPELYFLTQLPADDGLERDDVGRR